MHAVELCHILHAGLLKWALAAPLLLLLVEENLVGEFPLLGSVDEELGMFKII